MAIRVVSPRGPVSGSAFSSYEEAEDSQLIQLLQLGDDKAFETLMNRHRGIVWRAVRQHFGSIEDAEDIFQDVSLSFYLNRQSYQSGTAKFSSWLYRVTTNRCLDILRSRRQMKNQGMLHDDIPSSEMNSEDRLNCYEISVQLQALIDILPVQQKMALSMYYLEDKNIDDISLSLAVSKLAARSLIKRGKEKMRQLGAGLGL